MHCDQNRQSSCYGVEILITSELAASANLKINHFGSCISVSCSAPVTGSLKLSIFTSRIPGTELLLLPSIFVTICTNSGSRTFL